MRIYASTSTAEVRTALDEYDGIIGSGTWTNGETVEPGDLVDFLADVSDRLRQTLDSRARGERNCRRWAADELAEANRQAERAYPLEVRP